MRRCRPVPGRTPSPRRRHRATPTAPRRVDAGGKRRSCPLDSLDLLIAAAQLEADALRQAMGRNSEPESGIHRRPQWKVPGADVLDLLAAESLLELADAAGREAPQ